MILHLVTDGRRLGGAGAHPDESRRCLLRQVEYAVSAGVDVVQVREPRLDARELAGLVSAFVARARGTSTRVVVNDRMDVAIACGAAGVHLRADSVPAAAARAAAPPGFLIGRSVHGIEEARVAAPSVDYLVAGTVWPSRSKPLDHPLLGVDGFAELARALPVPVLAIGGVTIDRLSGIAAAGGAGVAAIGLFLDTSSREGRCRAMPLTGVVARVRARFDTFETPS